MTTDVLGHSTAPALAGPRISLAQMMAVVATAAALSAFYREVGRAIAVPAGTAPFLGPAVATSLLLVAGLAVGALRRASFTETALGLAVTGAALAAYGSLRPAGLGPLWLPIFLGLTVVGPLWLRLLERRGPEGKVVPAWMAAAGRLGLNASLTVGALVVATITADVLDRLMPVPPVPAPAFAGGPLPSPSFVVQAVATLPAPAASPKFVNGPPAGWSEGVAPPPPAPFPLDPSELPAPPVPEPGSPAPG